jgi:hypothetical protein
MYYAINRLEVALSQFNLALGTVLERTSTDSLEVLRLGSDEAAMELPLLSVAEYGEVREVPIEAIAHSQRLVGRIMSGIGIAYLYGDQQSERWLPHGGIMSVAIGDVVTSAEVRLALRASGRKKSRGHLGSQERCNGRSDRQACQAVLTSLVIAQPTLHGQRDKLAAAERTHRNLDINNDRYRRYIYMQTQISKLVSSPTHTPSLVRSTACFIVPKHKTKTKMNPLINITL